MAKMLGEVSLLPANVRVTAGRQAVALAAGHLDGPYSEDGTKRKRRKAVVVVLTAGWSILCFDHNLKLMWETSVQVRSPKIRCNEKSVVTNTCSGELPPWSPAQGGGHFDSQSDDGSWRQGDCYRGG